MHSTTEGEFMGIAKKFFRKMDEMLSLISEGILARRKLSELHNAIRPFAGYNIPESPFPYDPKLFLQATPQRYTENYKKYLEKGGLFQTDDIQKFISNSSGHFFDCSRFYFFNLVIDMLYSPMEIVGDIAELGVDKGNTASVLSLAAKRLGKTIYLLDTFEGFSQKDLVGVDSARDIAFNDTSLEFVRGFVDGQHVRFIKGHFPESAQQLPDNLKFCLVHLDCDLYKPFSSALEFFWPRLVPGGFLIMHDYNSLHWDGVEQAVNEFFE